MSRSFHFFLMCALTLTSMGVLATDAKSAHKQHKTLYFDKLSAMQFHVEVQQTIEKAYAQLGYKLVYREHPLKRSYVEASAGRLSGLMARVEQGDLKNLVKIPVALKRFNIVLIVDDKKCKECTFQTIKNLAAVSGFKGLQKIIANKNIKAKVFEVHDRATLFRMFFAGRVDAIAVSDVLMIEEFETRQTWRSEVIGEEVLYHYLHKDYDYLVPQITRALSEELATQ